MALLFQEQKDGIQLAKESDKCFICEREARKRRDTMQEGLLNKKEVFLLNLNGLRHCICMDHFKTLLGEYTLIEKDEYESTQQLLGSLLPGEDVLELDAKVLNEATTAEEVKEHIEEKIEEEKKSAKITKAAKSSKGK